jgi:hypothetical protein
MTDLRALRNIGDVTAAELEAAGIADGETLRAAGSVGAAQRLRAAGFDVCGSKLGGLEGAIRDVKWTLVPKKEREELWREFEAFTAYR